MTERAKELVKILNELETLDVLYDQARDNLMEFIKRQEDIFQDHFGNVLALKYYLKEEIAEEAIKFLNEGIMHR